MAYLVIIVVKLVQLVSMLLTLYMWAVIIEALLSWVVRDPYNPVMRFLYPITEPVLDRIRRWIPFVRVGGFDLSPIVVIVVVQIATALLDRFTLDLTAMGRLGA